MWAAAIPLLALQVVQAALQQGAKLVVLAQVVRVTLAAMEVVQHQAAAVALAVLVAMEAAVRAVMAVLVLPHQFQVHLFFTQVAVAVLGTIPLERGVLVAAALVLVMRVTRLAMAAQILAAVQVVQEHKFREATAVQG